MNVIRATILGFCAGVRRAVNEAEKSLEGALGGQVYTLGPLIHNPSALADFERKGVRVLETEEISKVKRGDTVIIRAHGVPPELSEKLEASGCTLVNATCPLVTASQKRAASYAERGFAIIFAGDKNHGEVVGIEGWAKKAAESAGKTFVFCLVRTKEDAENLFSDGRLPEKSVLLSQTTFSISAFDEISSVLKKKLPGLEVVSSICPATHERQDSLLDLCKKVDGILVIGGKTSANTNRLYATAKANCQHAALIETKDEIPPEFFSLENVGLTAGASTPDNVIDAVSERLLSSSMSFNKF